ncbi:MAG: PAS domain S-box protein [Planctomycetota bacterium]|jgi:PAS domain S-box-containing protein
MKSDSYRYLLFTIIVLSSFFIACRSDFPDKIPPQAVKGVLDLTGWDFKRDGPANLTGEYEFYWKQLLKPSDFLGEPPPQKPGYISVPDYWNNHKVKGEKLPGEGYATYRLKILLNNPSQSLALKFLEISTAYTGYVNGRQVCASGVPGKTPETTVPRYFPQIIDFEIDSNQIEVLLQVSNFHHRRGGAWTVIQLGEETEIRALKRKKISFDLFLSGSIFIIALYHFGLYILRRKDRSNFYFGVFCILLFIRLLSTEERYFVHFFPSLSWEWMVKLEYLSFYLAVPAFVRFMRFLFHDFSKHIVAVITILGLAFSLFVILTPASIYSHTLNIYEIITVAVFLYALYVIIVALLHKNVEALVFICGFMILNIAVINDMLHVERIIKTGFFVPFGFFIFILSQAFLLSLRSSRAFNTIKAQRKELKGTLEAYKNEILDRVRAEEALRISHERFLTVLDSIDADVYVADMENYEILFVNKHIIDTFGHNLIGKTCWKVFRNESEPCAYCKKNQLLDNAGNPTGVCIWEGKNPLTEKWYMYYVRAIKWVDERLVRLQVATDVTELKEAEEALRESEEKHRTILHSIEDGYYEVDIAGNLTFFNEAFCKILGYPKQELLGMNNRQFQNEENARKVYKIFNNVYKTGKSVKDFFEWEMVRKDGTKRLVESSVSLMHDANGQPIGFRGVARDITEIRNAEEQARLHQQQLMQASKMVALGTLVSGVAHEINNPNNFIMLNSPMLLEAWQDAMPILDQYFKESGDFLLAGLKYSEMRDKYPELFSGISDGANRIKQIVDDLKNYIREDTADLTQSVDINAVIKSAISLVANMVKRSTNHFSIDYGKNLPKLKGNFQHLEQVIINLIQNACQAIKDTEKGLFVSTAFDKDSATIVVNVRDEGIGIPPEKLPHIMDPFFTTKHDEGGVGLGLSISSRIIEEHGGTMRFTSETNSGTTAEICLPINRG